MQKAFIMKQFKDAELWIATQSYTDLLCGCYGAHGSAHMQEILGSISTVTYVLSMEQIFQIPLSSSGKTLKTVLWRAAKR